jgi:hypothetical protein
MNPRINRDDIFNSLIDTIYMLTAQPLPYLKLSNFFAFCGQPFDLEETCRRLGYKSFNHCIRENKEIFEKFLEIYVSKKDDAFLLHYQNRDIKNNGKILDNLKDKTIDNGGHVQITFDETIFFETQNELQFIQGRKKFAQAVHFCKEDPNYSGIIRMQNLQAVFPILFNKEYNKALLKLWFPNSGNMDAILQNILFEEIDFEYENPDVKQGIIFRLKDGLTIDKIIENLDNLETKIKPWFEGLERKIVDSYHSRKRYTPSSQNYRQRYHPQEQQQQHPSTNYNFQSKSKPPHKKSRVFVDSDSEEDNRVENRAFKEIVRPRKYSANSNAVDVGGDVIDAAKLEPRKVEKTKTDYIKKYKLSEDIDLVEFYDEAIEEAAELQKPIRLEKVEKSTEIEKVETSVVVGETLNKSEVKKFFFIIQKILQWFFSQKFFLQKLQKKL